jgi:hypothetical protein
VEGSEEAGGGNDGAVLTPEAAAAVVKELELLGSNTEFRALEE